MVLAVHPTSEQREREREKGERERRGREGENVSLQVHKKSSTFTESADDTG